MSTSATIAINLPERNKVLAIRLQYDGSPDFAGRTLLTRFADEESLRALMALGNLLILGSALAPDPSLPHDFQTYQPDVCLADDGPDFGGPARVFHLKHADFEDFEEEYNYLFRNGRWYCNGAPLKRVLRMLDRGEDYTEIFVSRAYEMSPLFAKMHDVRQYVRDHNLRDILHDGEMIYSGFAIVEDDQVLVRYSLKKGGFIKLPADDILDAHRRGELMGLYVEPPCDWDGEGACRCLGLLTKGDGAK